MEKFQRTNIKHSYEIIFRFNIRVNAESATRKRNKSLPKNNRIS